MVKRKRVSIDDDKTRKGETSCITASAVSTNFNEDSSVLQMTMGDTMLRNKRSKPDEEEDSSSSSVPLMLTSVGSNVMAHILTFLEPTEILDVLTTPLCKDWRDTFCKSHELWRVLCMAEPFKAQVLQDEKLYDSSSDDDEDESVTDQGEGSVHQFRILYTSFVRCVRFLRRIQDDAINHEHSARHLSVSDGSHGNNNDHSEARGAVPGTARTEPPAVPKDNGSSPAMTPSKEHEKQESETMSGQGNLVRFGKSSITQRLLLPAATGQVCHTNTDLPWSCAIYSILNWMVAFAEVEGIQTMCLKILPLVLEHETQRMTAQRAGLADLVLRGMVKFPDSVPLHVAAFHTIVLLARPTGGREGMLFHTSMTNASGVFSGGQHVGRTTDLKSGIALMLDSMERFKTEEVLQAMSCWSLVNISLSPAQKEVLVKFGGIQATVDAMVAHPESAEVQFRALFALINMVIPSSPASSSNTGATPEEEGVQDDEPADCVIDEMVEQVVHLVVIAMQKHPSNSRVLNRACLVLFNLSLTRGYHQQLLLNPHCWRTLEWCLANYRTDQVLQQAAAGTLHRLGKTLSNNKNLRALFTSSRL